MHTAFFSVFPVLNLDPGSRSWFEDVTVEKVTASKHKQLLKVYIESQRLIPRNVVRDTEEEIKRQLFGNTSTTIELKEHYALSQQHTPEVIFGMYYDNIMDELAAESSLEASLFHKADKEFLSGNILHIEIPDNFVAAEKMKRVKEILVTIYKERFDIDLQVDVERIDKGESQYAIDAGEALKQEVRKIVTTYEEAKKESRPLN